LSGAAFGVGFVLGPAIGGLAALGGPRVPFFVAGSIALVNAVAAIKRLPETSTASQRAADARVTRVREQARRGRSLPVAAELCRLLVDPSFVGTEQRTHLSAQLGAALHLRERLHAQFDARNVGGYDLLHLGLRQPCGADLTAATLVDDSLARDVVTHRVLDRGEVLQLGHLLIPPVAIATA